MSGTRGAHEPDLESAAYLAQRRQGPHEILALSPPLAPQFHSSNFAVTPLIAS
jgi:hypothetical protein